MNVHVQLFSVLRDCLPASNKGQADISMPDNSAPRLSDLIVQLGIDRALNSDANTFVDETAWQVIVNGRFESDMTCPLKDGDSVQIFPPIAGG